MVAMRRPKFGQQANVPRYSAIHGKEKQGSSILQPVAFGIDEHVEPGRHGATQLQDVIVLVDVFLAVLPAFPGRACRSGPSLQSWRGQLLFDLWLKPFQAVLCMPIYTTVVWATLGSARTLRAPALPATRSHIAHR